jgi:NAD(P)-dependent dehydrogenase (short-subunit alcohol dehydrogenase family)
MSSRVSSGDESLGLGVCTATLILGGLADTPACTPGALERRDPMIVWRNWLITGSSRGLGRELAKAVLAAGHRLVATARKPEDLHAPVAQYGERVRAVELDVTDPAAARAAVAVATSAFGRLDVVVNNAGYANVDSIEDFAEDDFRSQIETNFFGVVNVTRAALPVLRAQRDGPIIQISSIGGRTGTPGLSAYQAAKWAVGGFSEVLAKEVSRLGIRVTVVEPGGMRTDWAGSSMRTGDIQSDYQPTVGAMVEHHHANADITRGDPAKCAQAILQVTSEKEPPLHLLLGSDAVFLAGLIATARAEEDAKWKALSMSTDFEGLVPFSETPVAKLVMPGRG